MGLVDDWKAYRAQQEKETGEKKPTGRNRLIDEWYASKQPAKIQNETEHVYYRGKLHNQKASQALDAGFDPRAAAKFEQFMDSDRRYVQDRAEELKQKTQRMPAYYKDPAGYRQNMDKLVHYTDQAQDVVKANAGYARYKYQQEHAKPVSEAEQKKQAQYDKYEQLTNREDFAELSAPKEGTFDYNAYEKEFWDIRNSTDYKDSMSTEEVDGDPRKPRAIAERELNERYFPNGINAIWAHTEAMKLKKAGKEVPWILQNFLQLGGASETGKGEEGYFDKRYWNEMSDSERARYFYLYNTEGQDAANEYLQFMHDALAYRRGKEQVSDSDWENFKFSARAGLKRFGAGLAGAFGDTKATADAVTSQMIREKFEKEDHGFYKFAYDISENMFNNMPSQVIGALSGSSIVGAGVMGVGAYGNTYADMKNAGYTDREAATMGLLVGASETALGSVLGSIPGVRGIASEKGVELLGGQISKLFKTASQKAFVDWAAKGLGRAWSEGVEEYMQDILEPVFRNAVLGEDNKIDLLSPDALYSGLIGATSSALGGAGSSIFYDSHVAAQQGRFDANLRRMQKYGMGEQLEAELRENASELLQAHHSFEGKNRKELTSGEEMEKAIVKKVTGLMKKEKWSASDVGTMNMYLSQLGYGPAKTTGAVVEAMKNDIDTAAFVGESPFDNVHNQKELDAAYEKAKAEEGADIAALDAQKQAYEDAFAARKKLRQITGGRFTRMAVNQKIQENAEAAQKNGSTAEFRLKQNKEDGTEAALAAMEDSPSTWQEVQEDLGAGGDFMGTMQKLYMPGQDVQEYFGSVGQIYQMAKEGVPQKTAFARIERFAPELSPDQAQTAWQMGHNEWMQTGEAKERKKGPGKLRFDPSVKTDWKKDKTKAGKRRQAALSVLEKMAEMGVDITVFESDLNENPNAENGHYDQSTDSIWVDLNAWASDGQKFDLMPAVSHEMVHLIKQHAPKEYKELQEAVLRHIEAQEGTEKAAGVTLEMLIDEKKKQYAAQGREISDELALEEITANGCERMLQDGSAMDQLKADSPSLWNRIKSFFEDLIRKLKDAYAGYAPKTAEAVFMEDAIEQVQGIYNKAFSAALNQEQAEAPKKSKGEELADSEFKFSMRTPVESTKKLLAAHNLSSENLLKMFDLGGLPMPSIAVHNAKQGHTRFGKISLIFDKETIDPKQRRENKVYSGDAWTPMFPDVETSVNREELEVVRKGILSHFKRRQDYHELDGFPLDPDNVREVLNRVNGDLVKAFGKDNAIRYAFLDGIGKGFDFSETEERYSVWYTNQALQDFNERAKAAGYSLEDLYNTSTSKLLGDEKLTGIVADVFNKDVERQMASEQAVEEYRQNPAFHAEDLRIGQILELIEDTQKMLRAEARGDAHEVPDYYAAREKIEEIFKDEKMDAAYKSWLEKTFANILGEQGIRNKKDLFTPSGNRRDWKALHDPVTMDNILKAMRGEGKQGIGYLGTKNIFGGATRKLKSVDDIRDEAGSRFDESRSPEEIETELRQKKNGFIDRLYELAERFSIHAKGVDDARDVMVEAVINHKTESGIRAYLRKEGEGWARYSDDIADDLIQLVQDIRSLPATYFEAKPERAVGFDEIRMAIIPDNAPEALKKGLRERNIPFREYPAGDDAKRVEIANSLEDLKFSTRENTAAQLSDFQQLKETEKRIAQIESTIRAMKTLIADDTQEPNRSYVQKLMKGLVEESESAYSQKKLIDEFMEVYRYTTEEEVQWETMQYHLHQMAEHIAKSQKKNASEKDLDALSGDLERRLYQAIAEVPTHKPNMSKAREEVRRLQNELNELQGKTVPLGEYIRLKRQYENTVKSFENQQNRDRYFRTKEKAEKIFNDLFERFQRPTKTKHIPEALRGAVGKFLSSIDWASERASYRHANLLDAYNTDLDFLDKVAKLQTALQSDTVSKELLDYGIPIPEEFMRDMNNMIQWAQEHGEIKGKPSETEVADQMETIYRFMVKLRHIISQTNELYTVDERVDKLAAESVAVMNENGKTMRRNSGTAGGKAIGEAGDVLNVKNRLPVYMFDRFGEGGKKIFRALEKGLEQIAFDMRKAIDFSQKIYTPADVQGWTKKVVTFQTQRMAYEREMQMAEAQRRDRETKHGKKDAVGKLKAETEVRMNVVQLMYLYALTKRPQAKEHLLGAGITIDAVDGVDGLRNKQKDITLTKADLKRIQMLMGQKELAKAKHAADEMVTYMSTVCARQGNETHMQRFGYVPFKESPYVPIIVDRNELSNDAGKNQGGDFYKVLNPSFANPVVPDAKNKILIGSLIDIFADHAATMAQYHSMALPVLDAMRWFNYREASEGTTGEETHLNVESVKQAIESNYGKAAQDYVLNLMRDINGTTGKVDPYKGQALVRNLKIASVGGNIRVAALQVTAIMRAQVDMDTKYLLRGMVPKKGAVKEMLEKNGTALWKSYGYFDLNVGRSLVDQLAGKTSAVEKLRDASMWLPGKADEITWAAMWNAVKEETKDKHPGLEVGGEKYWAAVNERFTQLMYHTQVFDSVLSRSEYMRSNNPIKQMATSYMSEPTMSLNILVDAADSAALEKGRRQPGGKAGKISKVVGAHLARAAVNYVVGQSLIGMLEALFDAARDDDDYETFFEKWLAAVPGNILDDINPVSKIIVLRDLFSMLKGFDVERMDIAAINEIVDAGKRVYNLFKKLSGGKDVSSADIYGTVYYAAKGVSQLTGLPLSNVMRDLVSVYNTISNAFGLDKLQTSKTKSSEGYERLYKAMASGNKDREAQIRREMEKNGISERSIISGLADRLVEHEPKVLEAAMAYMEGRIQDSRTIRKGIRGFSPEIVNAAVERQVRAMQKDAEQGKEEQQAEPEAKPEDPSAYTSGEMRQAVLSGTQDGHAIIKDLMQRHMDAGKTETQAKGYLRGTFREAYKDAYAEGDHQNMRKMLLRYPELFDEELLDGWEALVEEKKKEGA